jgi:pimeloyl-ACP methyl ester carboxylesterase
VLVLLHGMGLTIDTFRGVAAYLLETHDLVLVDYSSLSVADGANGERVAIKAYVRSVFSILEALGVDRFSVAGNSLGGGLSLIVAIEGRGRVEKVLLSNPACFPQTLPRTYRLARVPLVGELLMLISAPEKLVGGVEYIGYVDKGRFERELRRRYEENFASRANRFKLMRIMRELPAEARDVTVAPHLLRLGEIDAEVLLTWGDQDPLLVEGAGERLARSLRRVTFERHADLAHMPHEEAPERVGRRWAAFLNEENC